MIATIIILLFMLITLLFSAYNHGKPRTGKGNFWTSLLAVVLWMIAFYYAGLFNNFKI
jgi:1-acyl-sn-glycerol-3-phosphate acyltransferase